MKYRLIASDIDGTLTEVWNQVNEKNREVLKKLVDQGVAFMIATGRSYTSAEGVLRALDIPCYACLMNGAVIVSYPEKKLIHTNYLSVEDKNLIMEIVQKAGAHTLIYNGFEGGDKIYFTDNYHLSPILKSIISTTTDRRLPIKDFIQDINHPIPVISVVGQEDEIQTLLQNLEPYRGQFNILKLKEIYVPNYAWLMITKQGADKVHGIQYVANMLGIEQQEIIAIGDDMNDLEMIKYAGLGIAMGNGIDAVKAVADMIAPPCKEDGMARILQEVYAL